MRVHLVVAVVSVLPMSCSCSPELASSTSASGDAGAARGDASRCFVRRDVVVNGSFSEGNSGFGTALAYSPETIRPSATYTVSDDPLSVHDAFPSRADGWEDHTPGDDNLSLLINGAEDDARSYVWSESVPAVQGVQYNFRAFVRALYPCPCGEISARVVTSDDHDAVLASGVAATQLEEWRELSAVWTATETGMVDLVIDNAETSYDGNDFALDDVEFIAEMLPEGCDLI